MDTKYPADSLHMNRSFKGTFSVHIKTALQCVSLGNVGPACILEQRENEPRKPCECNGWGDNFYQMWRFFFFPTDVFSGTHMAGLRAGYLRAHTAL